MNWWHFPNFLGMMRLHQMIQWFLSILASVQTSRLQWRGLLLDKHGLKSHFGVDKCPEVRTLCHPHSVVMVFAMDVLRTIVLASIGSKVFWFQLKSFPFWSVAMCPHALSRIFWPSYHKNRYLFMTCYWWKKIEELVELVVNVSDHPSEEGCHCHEQRCILSLEKPRHGANGNAQNTNVNRIGSFLKLSHDATEIEVVSCKL